MGCVGGFNKNCDKCICLLRKYGGIVKSNNYISKVPKEKIIANNNANICKKQLNETLEKMNKDVKYEHEYKQLKEFNEIYQNLLAVESERNKSMLDATIQNYTDLDNLNRII